jgi:hypothetical protein
MALAMMAVGSAAGCGTTRWSDTSRTATEQLVLSHAIDQAVSTMDFRLLAGQSVFFEEKYLDGVTDKGYIASSIRQQMLAAGCLLQEDRAKADFVVEARAGASGTDRHDQLLLGTPQLAMPALQPGAPSMIPEIPLVKKTHQLAAAKIAVFAFNRKSGEPVWQSGIAQYSSTAKNYWVFGAGPFESGRSRKRTTLGGAKLGVPSLKGGTPESEYAGESLAVAEAKTFARPKSEPILPAGASNVAPQSGPNAPAGATLKATLEQGGLESNAK